MKKKDDPPKHFHLTMPQEVVCAEAHLAEGQCVRKQSDYPWHRQSARRGTGQGVVVKGGECMQIKIDPEFKSLIPQLTPEEFAQLEENLLADGCRDPLIIWQGQGILLDGHNRLQICSGNHLHYNTHEVSLPDRNAAKVWIIRNQFGRRNITLYQRAEVALQLKELIAEEAKRRLATSTGGANPRPLQNSAKAEVINTSSEIAKIAGVSHDTISKVERISKNAVEPLREMVRRGEVSINAANRVAQLPKEEQETITQGGAYEVKRSTSARHGNNGVCGPKDRLYMTEDGRPSEAMAYSMMAISQLERIRGNDPRRVEALGKVSSWIEKQL